MAPISESISSIHDTTIQIAKRATAEAPKLLHRIESAVLAIRQSIVVVPASYSTPANNPSPGTVVGIVLGVVLGLCFILWILYTVMNLNNAAEGDIEIIKTRPRRSRNSARSERSEIIEVSRTRERSAPRRTREVIVEEVSRSRAPPSDDIVEVIEEHSPPRRPRRSSGYRNVDPNEFGGGRRDRRSGR